MFYICTMHIEMLNLYFISHFLSFFPNFFPFFHFFTISSPFVFIFSDFFIHFNYFFFFQFYEVRFSSTYKKNQPQKNGKKSEMLFFCKNFANLDRSMHVNYAYIHARSNLLDESFQINYGR